MSSEAEPKSAPFIDITTDEGMNWLRRLFISAQGGNPDAQQTLNEFLKFDNNIERTNLPTREDVHLVSYLRFTSKSYYPEKEDPFSDLAEALAESFMAKGGGKSNQFVELMKQTPSLADLQQLGEPPQRGLMDRILGRGSDE